MVKRLPKGMIIVKLRVRVNYLLTPNYKSNIKHKTVSTNAETCQGIIATKKMLCGQIGKNWFHAYTFSARYGFSLLLILPEGMSLWLSSPPN